MNSGLNPTSITPDWIETKLCLIQYANLNKVSKKKKKWRFSKKAEIANIVATVKRRSSATKVSRPGYQAFPAAVKCLPLTVVAMEKWAEKGLRNLRIPKWRPGEILGRSTEEELAFKSRCQGHEDTFPTQGKGRCHFFKRRFSEKKMDSTKKSAEKNSEIRNLING